MLKPFSLIFFVLVMVWCGAILVTSDPYKRMDRTCVPLEYADVGATAAMTLIDQGWGDGTHRFFTRMHYGCRYVIWSMFYESEWSQFQDSQRRQPGAAGQAPASSPAPDASAPKAPRKPVTH